MNLNEAISWLKGLANFKIEQYNLVAISQLLNLLGRPDKNLKFVHVAGTNGKVLVAKMCETN